MRWILVLLAAIISGVIVGLLLYFADVQFGFYLVVLFPLLGGILIGVATYLPVVTKKVATLPLILAAVVGCAIALGVYWGGQFLAYQESLIQIVQEQEPDLTRDEALEMIARLEESLFESTGFMAFLKDSAETGIIISRATSSSDTGGIELKDNLAYGFWIFEIIMMVGAALLSIIQRESSGITKRLNPQTT
jgi:hypothetical protein